MKRLAEIEQRKKEIRSLLESDGDVNVEEIERELSALHSEQDELEKRSRMASRITAGDLPVVTIQNEARNPMHEDVLSSPTYRSAYLKNLQGKPLSDVEKRTLTTAAGSVGSAVPTDTMNLIIDKLRQTSVLYPRITASFVPSNLSLVVANAKNAASWKAEGTNGTPHDDTVTSVVLTGFELIKLVEISAAASAMTISAFEAYLAAEIGRQIGIAIENAILNGSGSNEPTGILTGITWNAANSVSAALSYDALMDVLALLPTLYHQNAVFVMSRKMLFGGIRKLKDAAGNPLFTYNPQDRAAYSILGYPVIVDDYISDSTVLLGDLSYYYFNFAQQPAIEASREAGWYSGKVVYRGLAIADGKPALPEAFVKLAIPAA